MVYSSTSVCLAKSTSHGLDHPSLSLIGPLRVPIGNYRNSFWDNKTLTSAKEEMLSCSLKLPSEIVSTEGINKENEWEAAAAALGTKREILTK